MGIGSPSRLPLPIWARPAVGGLALSAVAVPLILVVGGRVGSPGHALGILGGGYGAAQIAITGADWLPGGWHGAELLLFLCGVKLIATVAIFALVRGPEDGWLVLACYAAGALLMPYKRFRAEARGVRHDIDRLAQLFGTSFEQTCHRLSTLQREDARGVPFFFCRVDMAGNITKRHSATRLQFARFGGACPLWIVHEAVAIPDRILVQLAETPDGVRYVSMAKGLVKPSGSYDRSPRRYAVALGCEVQHADEFVYADGIDLLSERAATPIGVSCRICPRPNCDQRAYPPSDQQIAVDLFRRGIIPYEMKS